MVLVRGSACRGLYIAQRDPGIQRGHDEACSQYVGMHRGQSGSLADGAHPAVSGAPVEALTVAAAGSGPDCVRRWPNGISCGGGRRVAKCATVALALNKQRGFKPLLVTWCLPCQTPGGRHGRSGSGCPSAYSRVYPRLLADEPTEQGDGLGPIPAPERHRISQVGRVLDVPEVRRASIRGLTVIESSVVIASHSDDARTSTAAARCMLGVSLAPTSILTTMPAWLSCSGMTSLPNATP